MPKEEIEEAKTEENITILNTALSQESTDSESDESGLQDIVSYSIEGNRRIEISYPEGVDDEEVRAFLDRTLDNSSLAYSVSYSLEDGVIEVVYPEGVSDEDVRSFLEEEIEQSGLEGLVTYSINDGDTVETTYSEEVSEDEVSSSTVPSYDLESTREETSEATTTEVTTSTAETTTESTTVKEEAVVESEKEAEEKVEETSEVSESTAAETTEDKEDTSVINVPAEREKKKERIKKDWKEIKHSLSLSGSPYAFSYADFFRARDAISAQMDLIEFASSYGFAFNFSYDYMILKHMSIGAEINFNAYYQRRSSLPNGSLYYQIPLLFSLDYHTNGDALDFFAGLILGLDIASLTDTSDGYLMGGIELGLQWRFAEHWSILWKAMGLVTMQLHPAEPMYDSFTYTTQPAFIGVSYHI